MVRNLAGMVGSVTRRSREEPDDTPDRDSCLVCEADLTTSEVYSHYRVCPRCRFHYSMSARERITSLADPESFEEINRSIVSLDPLSFSSRESYTRRLFRDQRRTGLTEAVVTGTCTISGSPVMLIVLDFGFMGGTMGCVVGEKVALALERAVKRSLPAIAIVTSGGARIQAGVLSLMQMAKTTIAANKMNEAGLPYVTVLANPATGQAFGSFANLADIIMAEPGAIVGFSPFGVLKRVSNEPLSTESHTAESRLDHGLLDVVVDRRELRTVLGVLLDLLGPRYRLERADDRRPGKPPDLSRTPAWESVQLSRNDARPTSGNFMKMMFSNFVELHGDRSYADDSSIICGIAQLAGLTVMAIGQERGHDEISTRITQNGRTRPEGFRKAQRGLRLAAKFNMPIVTFIDTPGPDLSQEAEQRGLGNAIASTMALMARLDVPSVSVIIGEAGSGGALALGVADRTLMLENATYSAVSPEEAAEIIFQDVDRADEAAESMKLTAHDCRDLGIIDTVVPEPPGGAHLDPEEAARQLRRMIVSELVNLQSTATKKMLKDRYKKYRNIGEYSSYFSAALTREVNALQNLVSSGARWITRRSAPTDPPPKPEKPD